MAQDFKTKNRIKNINTIGKITRALQLVATANLKKASRKVQQIRPYSEEMYQIFHQIINNTNESVYLQKKQQVLPKKLWIVVTSNIGFCGGYNYNIYKLVMKNIRTDDVMIILGEKGVRYFTNRNTNIISKYVSIPIDFDYYQIQEIGIQALSLFNEHKIDAINLVYTKFINNLTFEATNLQLLPIIKVKNIAVDNSIEFEPDASHVLESALMLYLNTIIYSAICESQLSEQASRRLAMESATNNATDLKDELTLLFNRSRQAKITQELAEIIASADGTN